MRDQIQAGLLALLPRLRRFAIALTGSVTDAEELVQDACERALRHAGQVREVARVDSWIYGIMRNLWVDELRARRVRKHDDLTVASELIGDDGVATTEGRITLAAVRRELAGMPEEQRILLLLVCVDGLTYKEAAEVLNIPVGTVMSRLSRARLDLHDRLNRRARKSTVTKLVPRADVTHAERRGDSNVVGRTGDSYTHGVAGEAKTDTVRKLADVARARI